MVLFFTFSLQPTAFSHVWAEELQPVRIAFHVHTSVSDGIWTARRVLEEAQRAGLDGVVFADSLLERWEFGLPPLRRVVRKVVEEPSVLTWGAAPYLEHLRAASREVPNVLAIPGVSVSPFYRWTNIPLLRGGVLEHWHRQLVVVGLEDPRALTEFPAVSNAYASWALVVRHPWRLWPLTLVALGGLGWWRSVRARRRPWLPVSLVVIGLLLTANADLRHTSRFNPYQRDPGAAPYQHAIDYATARGGFVFWSHPAMVSEGQFGGIPVVTPPYTHLLLETRGASGFGVNYWNYVQPLEAGEAWDQLLLAYCRGQRAQPTWVVGEVGWHNTDRPLNMVETVAYVRERTPSGLLEALRAGRMYAQFNLGDGPDVRLTHCRLEDEGSQRAAGMGETLTVTGTVQLEVAGEQRAGGAPTTVSVIRDGAVVHQELLDATPFALTWRDDPPPGDRCSYYRVMLQRGTSAIYTNPIFVRRHVP